VNYALQHDAIAKAVSNAVTENKEQRRIHMFAYLEDVTRDLRPLYLFDPKQLRFVERAPLFAQIMNDRAMLEQYRVTAAINIDHFIAAETTRMQRARFNGISTRLVAVRPVQHMQRITRRTRQRFG
jgi:hypothetical protein